MKLRLLKLLAMANGAPSLACRVVLFVVLLHFFDELSSLSRLPDLHVCQTLPVTLEKHKMQTSNIRKHPKQL